MTPEEIAIKLAEVDQRARSNTHQIEEIKRSTEALTTLTVSVERIATKQEHLADSMDELRDDLGELKGKPAKRWETIVTAILTALVGALIGYFIR